MSRPRRLVSVSGQDGSLRGLASQFPQRLGEVLSIVPEEDSP
jgi:hypothetical protein